MATRARQAEATRQRILEAARDLFDTKSSGFTLDNVVAAAGTSIQTVLRAFGSKESLILTAIGTFHDRFRSFEQAASLEQAVAQLFDDYEEIGDRVVRILAEENQVAGFAEVARTVREHHRQWAETVFEAQLRRHPARAREVSSPRCSRPRMSMSEGRGAICVSDSPHCGSGNATPRPGRVGKLARGKRALREILDSIPG